MAHYGFGDMEELLVCRTTVIEHAAAVKSYSDSAHVRQASNALGLDFHLRDLLPVSHFQNGKSPSTATTLTTLIPQAISSILVHCQGDKSGNGTSDQDGIIAQMFPPHCGMGSWLWHMRMVEVLFYLTQAIHDRMDEDEEWEGICEPTVHVKMLLLLDAKDAVMSAAALEADQGIGRTYQVLAALRLVGDEEASFKALQYAKDALAGYTGNPAVIAQGASEPSILHLPYSMVIASHGYAAAQDQLRRLTPGTEEWCTTPVAAMDALKGRIPEYVSDSSVIFLSTLVSKIRASNEEAAAILAAGGCLVREPLDAVTLDGELASFRLRREASGAINRARQKNYAAISA
ncbi:uncharacterized protein LTR77_007706 [Saxophila tyrrhenica]|uniref:Uncharacterized protein n=1 Tax=Saxophila tyrrhenica TaxID=1690608 RepID=A0AAV9P672_9PEZI|nr:hypothetical protein LTR77_007706 [Saxophila tyrrhenica]